MGRAGWRGVSPRRPRSRPSTRGRGAHTDKSVKVVKPEFYEPPGQPGRSKFVLGDPTRPPLKWDEDFPYDPNATPTWEDRPAWLRWKAMLKGGDVLRSDLDDALSAYRHYMDGSGDPLTVNYETVNYEEAYREDPAIRRIVDSEISSAQQAAERLARESNLTSFKITGDPTSSHHPEYRGSLDPFG